MPRRNSTSSWSERLFQHGHSDPSQTSAGPALVQSCHCRFPIALGEAGVTPGFELQNPFVVHTRAASFLNDDHPEKYLDLAVAQTLRVTNEAGIKSMAIPAGWTGVVLGPLKTQLACQSGQASQLMISVMGYGFQGARSGLENDGCTKRRFLRPQKR